MPNINDINGVTVANLAKLDAVLKANISKVNGLTLSAAAAFLLDTYTGAAAAYSTRKLKTGVTVAARIRRSGDDIEADVEFDSNNEISLTSPISNASSGTYTDLADFVDHSTTPRNAFVDEWKDQSGSGNHAAQATAANQPKLYDATTGLITENGKPALSYNGSMVLSSASDISVTANTMHCVLERENQIRVWYGKSGDWFASFPDLGGQVRTQEGNNKNVTKATGQVTYIHVYDGSNVAEWYEDNSSLGTTNIGVQSMDYNDIGGFSPYRHQRKFQELILWSSAQSSTNISGIATDAMNHFSIT